MVAAFSLGVAAQADDTMAQTTVSNDSSLVALGCNPPKKKTCYRPVRKACRRVATTPTQTIKETRVVKTETIEKPVVIQAPQEKVIMEQPAVVENGPVVIDRYQKVHRSLIHLGLFPFSLFGQ